MNNFIETFGVSFKPLTEEALETARHIGSVEMKREGKKSSFLNAAATIEKAMEKDRVGFKRRYVRC